MMLSLELRGTLRHELEALQCKLYFLNGIEMVVQNEDTRIPTENVHEIVSMYQKTVVDMIRLLNEVLEEDLLNKEAQEE